MLYSGLKKSVLQIVTPVYMIYYIGNARPMDQSSPLSSPLSHPYPQAVSLPSRFNPKTVN